MIVSANIASCTPAEPITAGPRILKKARIAGSSRGRSRRRRDAGAARVGEDEERVRATPATATPQAAA